MRLSYLFIFIIWAPVQLIAQSVFTGRVQSAAGEAIPGASITIHDLRNAKIVAFGITEKEGKYAIACNEKVDSVLVRVRTLGYAVQERRVANVSQVTNFRLGEESIALKEVAIKREPITRHGDTLSYSVDAFKSKNDRVISDVISKLPGVEVLANGQILYQGNPINKYYIDGLDLLGGKYKLANDNLAVDAVNSVEVLENHQPIRMLDSLVFSDKAAINIRLKKKVTTTGSAKLGAGLAPMLWDANVTPMLFTNNNQFLGTYQSNNIGLDVGSQIVTLASTGRFNRDNIDTKTDRVQVMPIASPSFSNTRWLNNNTHLGSINYLKKLGNDFQMRVNTAYLNDVQKQRASTQTVYFTGTDTISVLEQKYNRLSNESLEVNVNLERNTKRKYLNNLLTGKGFWNRQTGMLVRNDIRLEQQVQNLYFSISNTLSNIHRLGKQLITVDSYLSWNKLPQALTVRPGQFSDLLGQSDSLTGIRQDITQNAFYANNSVGLTKSVGNFTLIPKMGIQVEHQQLSTDLEIPSAGEKIPLAKKFENHLNWMRIEPYAALQVEWKKKSWRIKLESPLRYSDFKIEDRELTKKIDLNKVVYEPRLSIRKDLNAFWVGSGAVGYKNQFGELEDIHFGYIMRNYRTMQLRDVPLEQKKIGNATLGIYYRNPLNAIFGQVMAMGNFGNSNLLYGSKLSENGAMEYSAQAIANRTQSGTISSQIGKYFTGIKTNISIGLKLNNGSTQQLINGKLSKVTTRSTMPNARINTNFNKSIDFDYSYKLNAFGNRIADQRNKATVQQINQLKMLIYPFKGAFFTIQNDFYVNHFGNAANRRNMFTDMVFRYKMAKTGVDLELNWNNVWNTSSLTTVSSQSFSYVTSDYLLRPTQVVASVKFSF